jgi:hypothetical protein
MLPARQKKVDLSTLTEEEKKLFRLYGKLPTHKNVLTKVQKDRKYFDSGDYALSKAGVTSPAQVGTTIPNPENIPHASSPTTASHMPISSPPVPSTMSHLHTSESAEATDETAVAPAPAAVPAAAPAPAPVPAPATTTSAPAAAEADPISS